MDLNAIYLFVQVVDTKSFTRASEKTGVATSSISRKISELEASLNIRLLERTTRQLRLTEKGRIFYQHSKPAVMTLNAAKQNIIDNNNTDSGTLRITAPPGIEKSLILPLIKKFKQRYPNICVKILFTGSPLKFIEDGIDIALRLGGLSDSNLIAVTLMEYEHILVANPDYIKIHGIPAKPQDLVQHQLICGTNWYDSIAWKFIKNNKKIIIDVNETVSLNHYAAIQLAIESGMGIGELPSINCSNEIQLKKLVPVLTDWQFSSNNLSETEKLKLSIVYSSNRYNSEIIKTFKSFCIKHFNTL